MESRTQSAVEIFRALPEGTLCEVIENTLYMSPRPTIKHQRIIKRLLMAMENYVQEKKLGEMFQEVDVFLDEKNAFQPDLLFSSKENFHLMKNDENIEGAPDLIVEVLSPSSRSHDLVKKKAVYERTGVKEYWAIDPETKEATGFAFSSKGYESLPKEKGKIKSLLLKKTFYF